MIRLETPLKMEDLKMLNAGDKVLISGIIYTARDQAHKRLIESLEFPLDLEGQIIYYTGPTPTKPGEITGSIGPTTASRMDPLTKPLLEKGLAMTIGKGERSDQFRKLIGRFNHVYCMAVGGTGALLANHILSSEVILYEDLRSEAIRKLMVKDFPVYVAYDMFGHSIFGGDHE
jgi:fumarate hydratase subunit beta